MSVRGAAARLILKRERPQVAWALWSGRRLTCLANELLNTSECNITCSLHIDLVYVLRDIINNSWLVRTDYLILICLERLGIEVLLGAMLKVMLILKHTYRVYMFKLILRGYLHRCINRRGPAYRGKEPLRGPLDHGCLRLHKIHSKGSSENQGCCKASSAVMRFSGFDSRQFCTRSCKRWPFLFQSILLKGTGPLPIHILVNLIAAYRIWSFRLKWACKRQPFRRERCRTTTCRPQAQSARSMDKINFIMSLLC